MASAARGWSNHASGDEVSEAIVWCVEWGESGDRATPICDDHFLAGFDAVDVLAETVLEVANPDDRPRSSYVHASSVATSGNPIAANSRSLAGQAGTGLHSPATVRYSRTP